MQHRRSGAGLRRPKAVWSWGVVWVCAGLVVLGCSEGHEAPPSIEVEAVRPRWQALGYRKALWAEGRDLTATDAESLAQIGDAKVTFTGSLERGFEYSMVQIGDFGALSTWNIAEEFLEFASDQGLQPVQEVDFYSNPLVTVEQARASVEEWELSGYIETDDRMDLAEDVPRTQLWLIEGYPLALPSAERERLRAALRERYPAP